MTKAINGEITCSTCHTPKPTTEFYRTNAMSVRYFKKCKVCWAETAKKHNLRRRLIVLKHYGGDPPRCACCGETTHEFLVVDHINGGGDQHRLLTDCGTGSTFCSWLIRNNFPVGYRVLCQNCNSALGFFGYCPHKTRMEVTIDG